MPTIDEIISSAVTQLTTKRTNIRTALQSKYNQTIPSSMTFGDVPTYITNVANYQYSLGLADGESSGGGSYMNENNAQLLNSYVATGGQSQHNGTYTKLENTYHRGFNVYKNNSYDMYLVCVDDNGNCWQVCTEPSETSYQYKEGSGTSFGPVGSYSRNTSLSLSGTVVISAPGSSSSAISSSVSSSSDESSIPSQSSSSGGGDDSSEVGAENAPSTVYVVGTNATSNGYAGTYTKQSQVNNQNAVYYCGGTGKYLFVVRGGYDRDYYAWVFSTTVTTSISTEIGFYYSYYSNTASSLIGLADSPVGLTINGGNGYGSYSSAEFSITDVEPADSSGTSVPSRYNCYGGSLMMTQAEGYYNLDTSRTGYNNTPVYSYYTGSTYYYLYCARSTMLGENYWIINDVINTTFSEPVSGTAYVLSDASLPPRSWDNHGVTVVEA